MVCGILKDLVLEISDDLFMCACSLVVHSNNLHTGDPLKDKNVTSLFYGRKEEAIYRYERCKQLKKTPG